MNAKSFVCFLDAQNSLYTTIVAYFACIYDTLFEFLIGDTKEILDDVL